MNDNLANPFLIFPRPGQPQYAPAGVGTPGQPLTISIPSFRMPPARSVALAAKRLIDLFSSAVLLVLLSPVMLAAALAVAASGGPVFFAQKRLGLNGKPFDCYKFRSMVQDADVALAQLLERDPAAREEWGRAQKLARDPRVTRVGAFLRRTSIDELPQLFNVLIGDMSLVGPRPIMPDQLGRYGRSARWYTAMRPGITGLWQVLARGDADFKRRVKLDCSYVRRYHFLLDIGLLFRTVGVVLSGRGAM